MILIVQFRTDQSGPHDALCFYEGLGVPYNMLRFYNAADPSASSSELQRVCDKADGIIFGGCGEASFCSKERWKQNLVKHMKTITLPVIKQLVDSDSKPVLGICFGNQMISHALGCEIIRNPETSEGGIVQVVLNDSGIDDPLFIGMKDSFSAIAAHKDSVQGMPKNSVLLGSSERYNAQIVKIGKYIYTLMFHPELNEQQLEMRLRLYPEYRKSSSKYVSSHVQTNTILHNFASLTHSQPTS